MLCFRPRLWIGRAGGLADDVQLALQRVRHEHVVATADEDLADDRLASRTVGDMGMSRFHRHIAPAQQHLAFGLDGALQLLLAGLAGGVLLGQEDHAHAVFARRRQLHALLGHLFAVELIGNLDQDACAIAHQRVGAHSATVVDVLEDLQRAQHDVVALLTLDVGHKAQTAGIVFIALGVQAVLLEMCNFCSRSHGAHPLISVAGTCRLRSSINLCKKI